MKRVFYFWIIWIGICNFTPCTFLLAQDSLGAKKIDTTIVKMEKPIHENYYKFYTKNPIPKRAAMYSAILPGLGQAHNRQYWKIPIVYAGVAVSTYLIYVTYNDYQKFRKAFIIRTDNNPNTIDDLLEYDVSALREIERNNRARLDRIVVYSAAYYGLNIIDALVSAHLKNFDVSKNISLQIQPTIINNVTANIGFKATIKF